MEDKIMAILNDINPEILEYTGNTMLEDGIIDSFAVLDILSALEDEFDIEIDAEYAVSENFANKEAIIEMMKILKE